MVEECLKHLKVDIELGHGSWKIFELALPSLAVS